MVATKLIGDSPSSRRAKARMIANLDDPAGDCWERGSRVIRQGAVPGDPAAKLSDFSRADCRYPASHRRTSEGHRGDDWSQAHCLMGSHW